MTQIVDRPGDHGTDHLEKDESGARIDVGLRRPFGCNEERYDLQSAQE
jgi:hypothetical protein